MRKANYTVKIIALYAAPLLVGFMLLTSCNIPTASTTPTPDANTILTQAAGTVAVELTKSAALTPSPTNPPLPTNTSAAPAATVAAPPTQAPALTNTTAPATNNNPPATSDDAASFVADVTIPDGTGAAPGIPFEKVWRIKNTGKSTWTVSYSLVWVDGEKMNAPDSIPMPKEVRPGETVDLSIKMTAPQKPGSYQTFFRLRNAAGQFFKLDGSGDLWVKIAVGGSTATPDLTATSAAATPTTAPTSSE